MTYSRSKCKRIFQSLQTAAGRKARRIFQSPSRQNRRRQGKSRFTADTRRKSKSPLMWIFRRSRNPLTQRRRLCRSKQKIIISVMWYRVIKQSFHGIPILTFRKQRQTGTVISLLSGCRLPPIPVKNKSRRLKGNGSVLFMKNLKNSWTVQIP